MNVELTVDLVKKRETPWPRIENDEWMMSLGAARPLEDAARIAFKDMVRWVQEKTGLGEMDAYEFVSQNAARADRRDRGSGVHGAREDPEGAAAEANSPVRREGRAGLRYAAPRPRRAALETARIALRPDHRLHHPQPLHVLRAPAPPPRARTRA